MLVGDFQVAIDGLLQGLGAGMSTASDLLLGEWNRGRLTSHL
jgi:hypothetical protein